MEQNHKTCLICGTTCLNPLKGYERFYLVKCHKCNFVFTRQIPTQKELEICYEGYERDDYLSPITIKRYNELLDYFEKYRKNNNILDIGCGIGYFLEIAKQRGWNVYGTEFTDKAVGICKNKGIITHKGRLNHTNYNEIFFDVVTSFEVLEHINKPIEEIYNIHMILRHGGAFYLTTPNFNSFLRYYLKNKYNVIGYPEHLCYYTPTTLSFLFGKYTFKKIYVKTTGFSLTRFKTSLRKSEQKFISPTSDDEKLRNIIEKNNCLYIAKKTINSLLTLLGKGDTIKAFFEKT